MLSRRWGARCRTRATSARSYCLGGCLGAVLCGCWKGGDGRGGRAWAGGGRLKQRVCAESLPKSLANRAAPEISLAHSPPHADLSSLSPLPPPPTGPPRYQFFGASPLLGGRQFEAEFDWGGTHVVVTSCIVEGIRVFFVDPYNGFFNSGTVYTDKM